jgi:hypothetical protein
MFDAGTKRDHARTGCRVEGRDEVAGAHARSRVGRAGSAARTAFLGPFVRALLRHCGERAPMPRMVPRSFVSAPPRADPPQAVLRLDRARMGVAPVAIEHEQRDRLRRVARGLERLESHAAEIDPRHLRCVTRT